MTLYQVIDGQPMPFIDRAGNDRIIKAVPVTPGVTLYEGDLLPVNTDPRIIEALLERHLIAAIEVP